VPKCARRACSMVSSRQGLFGYSRGIASLLLSVAKAKDWVLATLLLLRLGLLDILIGARVWLLVVDVVVDEFGKGVCYRDGRDDDCGKERGWGRGLACVPWGRVGSWQNKRSKEATTPTPTHHHHTHTPGPRRCRVGGRARGPLTGSDANSVRRLGHDLGPGVLVDATVHCATATVGCQIRSATE
jgi:hypothetical protein